MDCIPPATKKRRLENDEVAAAKDSLAKNDDNILLDLPVGILQELIFQFLAVRDLTCLASTSHRATKLVNEFRGPFPFIIREELLPVQVRYISNQRYLDNGNNGLDVHSIQIVRFLLKTTHQQPHRTVQVEITQGNGLWSLTSDADYMGGLDSQMWLEAKIVEREDNGEQRSRIHQRVIFETVNEPYHSTCSAYDLEGYTENRSNLDLYLTGSPKFRAISESHDAPKSILQKQRFCTDCILVCAKRIAKSPPKYNLPSLGYILCRTLPMSFYKFLPEEVTKLVDATQCVGPRFLRRWKHRYPPSEEDWEQFLSDDDVTNNTPIRVRRRHGHIERDFYIHDITWYSTWYPRPVMVYPKNLLASLPDGFIFQNIFPYLFKRDHVALTKVIK